LDADPRKMESGRTMAVRTMFAVAACALLAGCSGGKDRPAALSSIAPDWRQVATSADRERLRTWRQAWVSAVSKAQASGDGKAIAAGGALFEPDLALSEPMPPPGDYRCRVFKIGAHGSAMRDFTAYPYGPCRIEAAGGLLRFSKVVGSQRVSGLAYADGTRRAVFLGTMMLSDERNAIAYGRDPNRDVAGIIQRVGNRRWRMMLPYPRFESLLDVVEIVPAG
jgi:hypothetical protein